MKNLILEIESKWALIFEMLISVKSSFFSNECHIYYGRFKFVGHLVLIRIWVDYNAFFSTQAPHKCSEWILILQIFWCTQCVLHTQWALLVYCCCCVEIAHKYLFQTINKIQHQHDFTAYMNWLHKFGYSTRKNRKKSFTFLEKTNEFITI